MNIILISESLSRSELEAGLPLTRAFFPEAKVRTEVMPLGSKINDENLIGVENSEKFAFIKIDIVKDLPHPKVKATFITFKQDLKVKDEITAILNQEEIKNILVHNLIGKDTENKVLLKHLLFNLLTQVTKHTPPWGILTGIRPSKILHRLNDQGISKEMAKEILEIRYQMRKDKIALLQDIVERQRPYLEIMKNHSEGVAIYVGIPFCPTRCTYCSFPAYSLQKGREPLQTYLKGLKEEIQLTGKWMKDTGRVVDSLYIGGGTPTILSTKEIAELIQFIKKNLPLLENGLENDLKNNGNGSPVISNPKEKFEFSVEAGRPDTLSKEKLKVLHELGVNRLSINPQTMHNDTLQRIGRAHTVEDILRIYELAREISNWIINMDLILGLPGEKVEDVEESLVKIGELKPDNLTVHALAIKRGSRNHELGLKQSIGKELELMQERVLSSTSNNSLYPYYLYRQKHIAGNLENIGFAQPGKECRYNIAIMEERQSIIGIGAGATSKVVNTQDYSLVNLFHPSNWQAYLKRWREDFQKRRDILSKLLDKSTR